MVSIDNDGRTSCVWLSDETLNCLSYLIHYLKGLNHIKDSKYMPLTNLKEETFFAFYDFT